MTSESPFLRSILKAQLFSLCCHLISVPNNAKAPIRKKEKLCLGWAFQSRNLRDRSVGWFLGLFSPFCLETTCLGRFLIFGLLINKVGRYFDHLVIWENAPNVLMRLSLLCTMHLSYKLPVVLDL
jgi:hypothetical protein